MMQTDIQYESNRYCLALATPCRMGNGRAAAAARAMV